MWRGGTPGEGEGGSVVHSGEIGTKQIMKRVSEAKWINVGMRAFGN